VRREEGKGEMRVWRWEVWEGVVEESER